MHQGLGVLLMRTIDHGCSELEAIKEHECASGDSQNACQVDSFGLLYKRHSLKFNSEEKTKTTRAAPSSGTNLIRND
jgi:hypothetical protein